MIHPQDLNLSRNGTVKIFYWTTRGAYISTYRLFRIDEALAILKLYKLGNLTPYNDQFDEDPLEEQRQYPWDNYCDIWALKEIKIGNKVVTMEELEEIYIHFKADSTGLTELWKTIP